MNKITYFLFLVFVSISSSNHLLADGIEKPKNIIVMIGDGMGPGAIKAYRIYRDDPQTSIEESLVFDPYLVGTVNTQTADEVKNITDSAASATAYATGQKVANGVLSIGKNGEIFETVLEVAKKKGKATGLVVTSELYHATPAAFAAHVNSRGEKQAIAEQLFNSLATGKPVVDVLLGGGLKEFQRSNNRLINEFKKVGYEFFDDANQLKLPSSKKALGVFAKKGLSRHFDKNAKTPSLIQMTDYALSALSKNENGFFLMVEGSQIDWAAHDNDIVGVMSEMTAFEQAVERVLEFAKQDGETLVLITADHVTGGLSVGANHIEKRSYFWDVDTVKSYQYTPEKILKIARETGNLVSAFQEATTRELTKKEKKYLKKINLKKGKEARRAISQLINKQTNTGWTSTSHTGEDVYIYAFGKGKSLFYGYQDNTEIGKKIFQLLNRDKAENEKLSSGTN